MLYEDLTSFLKSAKNPLVIILGPTASGKTSLSLKIAKKFGAEILSTDSRQIYQEMSIATDCISEEETQGIPHHMLQFAKPDEIISLAQYKVKALDTIEKIYERKAIPMLVGGTGLYVSAITEGYAVPRIPANPELRAQLESEAKEHGNKFVHDKLAKLDSAAAKKIHPNNLRYVIRAIEINLTTDQPKQDLKETSNFDVFKISVERPRAEIYERINARVDQQVGRGLLQEVQALLDKGYALNIPSMTSLGVKEIIPHLKGEDTLENCLEILKQNTRNYAKRQMTWCRRYDNVQTITPNEIAKL